MPPQIQPLPPWYPQTATSWQKFRTDPATFIARWLYEQRKPQILANAYSISHHQGISIVCISDTHNTTPQVPDGDVLLHAGDLTNGGSFDELQAQLDWLNTLPHRYKVVIAGNHDRLLDPEFVARFPDRISEGEGASRQDLDWGDLIYLNNTATTINLGSQRSLKIYGSPLTEACGNWAFQYPPIRRVWDGSIPDDIDILLTHGPPKGHLDLQGKGCPQLLKEITRVRPQLVVFGHLHAGYGQEVVTYDRLQTTYDKVMMGEKGLLDSVFMLVYLLIDLLAKIIPLVHGDADPSASTILVNASSLIRSDGGGTSNRPAMVVEL